MNAAHADATQTSDHRLILSSRVNGTPVFQATGERIGHVDDLSIEKHSGRVIYAIMSFGGFLGIGEKFHPVPWSMLDYSEDKGGYVVPMNKDVLEKAPNYDLKDLTKHDGSLGGIREKSYDYYNIERDWQ